MANIPSAHEVHNLSPNELIATFLEGELAQAQQNWDNENATIIRLLREIEALEAVKRKSEIALCGHQMLIDLYQDELTKVQNEMTEAEPVPVPVPVPDPFEYHRIPRPYLPGENR